MSTSSDETYEPAFPPAVLPNLCVAILGAGKMGGILLQAFLKNNLLLPDQILATVQHPDRALALSVQFGVEVGTSNLAAAEFADVILLGVKPIQVPAVVAEIPTAIQDASRGVHGRRRNVGQAAPNTNRLKAMPQPICSFQNGKLVMASPGGYFTARLTESSRPQ